MRAVSFRAAAFELFVNSSKAASLGARRVMLGISARAATRSGRKPRVAANCDSSGDEAKAAVRFVVSCAEAAVAKARGSSFLICILFRS